MRRCRLTGETFLLTVIGFLGLLVLFEHNGKDVMERSRPTGITITTKPARRRLILHGDAHWVKETPVCKANSSVTNISGFAELPGHIQDFLRYRHCRYFPTLLDVPGKCGGAERSTNVFLFLVIKSSPGNYERRAIIRKTWGEDAKYQGAQVRRLFISGVNSDPFTARRMNKLLRIESREHNDILQWNFYDTFFNLTLKQFLFYQWMEVNCPGARFVFNGDDDVFVNTFSMVNYLLGMSGSNDGDKHLYVGQLIANVGPIRETWSKYYVPVQVVSSNSYPPYCGGGGILMSGFSARAIHNQSLSTELIPIDDVYLGMCLEKAGLKPRSHMGMRTTGVNIPSTNLDSFDPCYYRELLMVHRFVPYEMLVMWNAIQDTSIVCGRKSQVYLSL